MSASVWFRMLECVIVCARRVPHAQGHAAIAIHPTHQTCMRAGGQGAGIRRVGDVKAGYRRAGKGGLAIRRLVIGELVKEGWQYEGW